VGPETKINVLTGGLAGIHVGQPWVIVSAPERDFSIDPEWLGRVERNLFTEDEQTGELVPYRWDKFLDRA
jgi:hypothetical protein